MPDAEYYLSNECIDKATDAYFAAALWSSTDPDTCEPLDGLYSILDVAPNVYREARDTVLAFCRDNWPAFIGVWEDPRQVGHDLWLTRNRHGTGFWDRYYTLSAEYNAGHRLTDAAHALSEVSLYPGDDGLLYIG